MLVHWLLVPTMRFVFAAVSQYPAPAAAVCDVVYMGFQLVAHPGGHRRPLPSLGPLEAFFSCCYEKGKALRGRRILN